MLPMQRLAVKDLSCKEDYEKSLTKRVKEYVDRCAYTDEEKVDEFFIVDKNL